MLLAGFDAPVLQVMYLDKPLKEHRLLQAIARTNRPFKNLKESGLIIDYLGIMKEFKRALEIYAAKDIEGVLYNIDEVWADFELLLKQLLKLFEEIPKEEYTNEVILDAIRVLTSSKENTELFLEGYAKLRRLFQLLGPDTRKVKRVSEFKWLSAIHTYYIKWVKPDDIDKKKTLVEKYFDKTIKFIHKTTELEELENELPAIEFDDHYVANLEAKYQSTEAKAASIVFTLNRLVLVDEVNNPLYESVSEKVSRLLDSWNQKTADFKQVYSKGVKIFEEIQELAERQKKLDFNNMQYSILLRLESEFGDDDQLVEDVKVISNIIMVVMFKGWTSQASARKKVESELRRFIRRYIKRYGKSLKDLDDLYQELVRNVEAYGN